MEREREKTFPSILVVSGKKKQFLDNTIFWKARYIGPTHILALIDVPKILDLENQNVCSALTDHDRRTPSNFLITCHM
jgi:hypothetical protein